MLLVEKYLLEHSIERLKEEYSIIVNQSNKYPELYLFIYNQIKSPLKDPLVQECRGLILNSQDNWNVVCYPFNKFFNLGENKDLEKQFDWDNYVVYPKLDGSLISLISMLVNGILLQVVILMLVVSVVTMICLSTN